MRPPTPAPTMMTLKGASRKGVVGDVAATMIGYGGGGSSIGGGVLAKQMNRVEQWKGATAVLK